MLDKNKIYLGDCLELMKEIPDKSVDCILTDPPYGITACKWDVKLDLEAMWRELKRIRKDSCNIVIFSKQPFTTDLIVSNRKEFRYELIWNKERGTNFANCNEKPMPCHENILLFGKKNVYNPQFRQGKPYIIKHKQYKISKSNPVASRPFVQISDGKYYPISIISFGRTSLEKHPTQKPIKLINYLIKTYSNETMLILDPFSGSGTTAVACHELNRNFICIEKEEQYYKMSCDRLEKAKQQGRLL